MRTVKLLAVISLVLAPVRARAQLAFTHVTVIDVATGQTVPGMTVVVNGARIAAVSDQPPPRGVRVIDAAGKFLIPGLWDMHVHAAFPGIDAQFLPLLVANGVTGVREMFSRMDWLTATRARVARGDFPGPTIIGSGHILDGVPQIWPGSVGAGDAASARRAVDSLAKAGADFIKVYSRLSPEAFFAAGREAKAKGLVFAGHIPLLVHAADASDSGMKSVEHLTQVLTGCEAMEDQIIADLASAVAARGWEAAGGLGRLNTRRWLDSFDPERCRRLAQVFVKNGTWMVPTIQVLHSTAYLDDPALASDPRLEYIPPAFKQGWDPKTDFRFRMLTPNDWIARKAVYARQLEIVTLLHKDGVRFLAGTDLSNPFIYPGFSLHDELAALVAAGFTTVEALQTATLNPAIYFGATDSLGSVAVGKRADLVLLDANPLEDIRNTTKIAAVVLRGKLYDAKALQRLLKDRAVP